MYTHTHRYVFAVVCSFSFFLFLHLHFCTFYISFALFTIIMFIVIVYTLFVSADPVNLYLYARTQQRHIPANTHLHRKELVPPNLATLNP